MAKGNDNHNPTKRNSLLWLAITVSIFVVLSLVLPFPISFIASIIAIFGLGIYRDDRALRKAGLGGIKGWYKSMFSSGITPRGRNIGEYQPLRFSCINCGNEHGKISCPNCGSKGVRPV
ncbi:MAG TPA: hypothetical protein VJ772_09955 [Nitrososphaeraceae archaeon]|nr:hypothetical protein [Nitrososphaeraceae archaeon]